MKTLAVVGTGIAGMACSYLLRNQYHITVYEKNGYIGGHTNTVNIMEEDRTIPIDTGFMVYNDQTYPNLVRFFRQLSIESNNTSMSFSISDRKSEFEASFSNLATFFPLPRSWLEADRYRLLMGLRRLFAQTERYLENADDLPALTLGEFVALYRIPKLVVNQFLLPMTSAIWSTPGGKMNDYPASTLFRFLKNHGMLGFGEQLQWKTLRGGSQQYKNKILKEIGSKIRVGVAAEKIQRLDGRAAVCDSEGRREEYDCVIIAAHANHALAMLDPATPAERSLLACFKYNSNPVCLHSDESLMPKARRAWASWNYRYDVMDSGSQGSTHYWMNSLQNVSQNKNYFVSVDYYGQIAEEKTRWRYLYEHPRFDASAIAAQPSLPALNCEGPVYFCGSYFRYGFHEDALSSALDVCMRLNGGRDPLN